MNGGNARGLRLGVSLGGVGLAAVAASVLYWQAVPAAPEVDPGLERAVLPVVDRYLTTDPAGPLGDTELRGEDGAVPQGFCTERVIEIRRVDGGLRVGLAAWCGHYVREGDGVTALDGVATLGVVTVSPASAPARVGDTAWEPDGDATEWTRANFSTGGAAEAQRLMSGDGSQLSDPEAEARAAFGLPG
ncbi:hypothetical protein OG539_19495 [Actinacidiphila glaucinigra]|uniref:hypothetical protein n=1 Tax=Actinacidiphila glaucinigra TaxID=235986 RepID=UPI00325565F6